MSETSKLQVDIMRSQLGRVRGLGAAKSGVGHWWAERLTAIALVPLTLWFVFDVVRLLGATQGQIASWAARPWNTVLLLSLVIATFHHMQLGLQVVIDDYVHAEGPRLASILAIKAISALLALACIVAILKLAFVFNA
jgi:succinate dehydrogenase / fumarate reductase membrane anchor subunit